MPSVLFVCTANMCRSPMAEVLFRDELRQRDLQAGWSVGSAGVAASHGMRATEFTARVVTERGLDLAHHRSRPVDAELLRATDLVLVMEEAHRQTLREQYPRDTGRVHLLTEMAGEDGDVHDPVGTTIENYRRTADQLSDLFARGFDRIRALAEAPRSSGHASEM